MIEKSELKILFDYVHLIKQTNINKHLSNLFTNNVFIYTSVGAFLLLNCIELFTLKVKEISQISRLKKNSLENLDPLKKKGGNFLLPIV